MPANILSLLVVENERVMRDSCREVAQSVGFQTYAAENATAAYREMDAYGPDVVLLDMRVPGSAGLEVLREIKRRRPETEVIVMTANATVQSAVQAMKAGAYDYLMKPFAMEELKLLLERVAVHLKTRTENQLLRSQVKNLEGFGGMVGRSAEMEKLYRMVGKVANSGHPVLITGESGTGKEMVARAIHYCGNSTDRPFIPVDCGSLVPTLIESELFGYVKGAFTGATRSKDGLLAIAEGGTVFLDEIGELPVDLQAKLLRAIQEKEIRPVGSTKRVAINVRILAATNRDLEAAVQHGSFRKDLYFRINVVNLRIPPLRERRQDIPLLVAHFLERINRAMQSSKKLSDDALKLLMEYEWPGNVRELENSLERACALSSGPVLHVSDLPSPIQNHEIHVEMAEVGNGRIVPFAELERHAIVSAIQQLRGDKAQAARMLGIGKTTLYRKLKEYRIQ